MEAEDKNCSRGDHPLHPSDQDGCTDRGGGPCRCTAGKSAIREMLAQLTIYAENLGLAFQICDDILDVIGEEEKMGKKAGMDSINKKATYPALYGLEKSKEHLEELTDTAIEALAR